MLEIRDAFPHGKYPLRIEQQDFRLKDYHAFLRSIENDAGGVQAPPAGRVSRRARTLGAAAKLDESIELPDRRDALCPESNDAVPDGCRPVRSPITASVWNIAVETGQRVEAGRKLIVLEAMKMEIASWPPPARASSRS